MNAANERMRFVANRNDLSTAKTVERAPLNVIKYVKIVVDEKIADTLDINEDISDGEVDVENLGKIRVRNSERKQRQREHGENSEETSAIRQENSSLKTSKRFVIKTNSANNNNNMFSSSTQQKQNYCSTNEENVKIPINSCNNDKCLPDDTDKFRVVGEEIDQKTTNSTTNHDKKDFCINIYNLISAKESLV